MDGAAKPGEEEAMSVTDRSLEEWSDEARTLWSGALALNRAAGAVSLPPLLIFTDPVRVAAPWTVAARLPVGAAVVYRHFGAADREATARRLREITAHRRVRLLIGLDADLAEQVGADGLHLPERARGLAAEIRARHPQWTITAAAHADTAEDAETGGLDALVMSPVFATLSPSPLRPLLGVEGLARTVRQSKIPVYGLGGIDAATVGRLAGTGACGIAGVDGFTRAFSP